MNMKKPGVIIQWFHKWSGIPLIVLIVLKIISGYAGEGNVVFISPQTGYLIHASAWVDVPLLFLFILHAAYGILKNITRFETRNKPVVFWTTTILALIVFFVAVCFIFII